MGGDEFGDDVRGARRGIWRSLTRTVMVLSLSSTTGFAAGLHFEAGDPGLDGPGGVDFLELEEGELVGIFRREDLGVAAVLGDVEAARGEPCAACDVLGIAKLRGGDFFAAEIGGRLEIFIGLARRGRCRHWPRRRRCGPPGRRSGRRR